MQTPALSNSGEYAVYRIRCQYELEDVMVTLIFKIDGTQVEGLFFDSTQPALCRPVNPFQGENHVQHQPSQPVQGDSAQAAPSPTCTYPPSAGRCSASSC